MIPPKNPPKQIRQSISKLFFDVKFQKFCLLWLFIGFPALLGFTILITVLSTNYSITTNWISDLGSGAYAPFPWLLDYDLMITALLLFPVFLLLEKKLVPYPESDAIPHSIPSRLRLHVGSVMLFSYFLGVIGCFAVGFFSEDRDNVLSGVFRSTSAHVFFAWLAFGSIAMGFFLAGLLILSAHTVFPKILGAYCLFGPEIAFIVAYTIGGYIPEWVLMFTFLGAFGPVGLILLREMTRIKSSKII